MGVMVPPDHLSQVMYELVLVAGLQVVKPGEDIAAGAPRDSHPVGRGVTEGLKDACAPVPRGQQHPALIAVPGTVPLPFRAPEAAPELIDDLDDPCG